MFAVTLLFSQWVAGSVAVFGAIMMLAVQHRIATRDRLVKHPDPVQNLAVDSAANQFEAAMDTADRTDEAGAVAR